MLSILMDLGLVNGSPDELHEDGDGQFRPTETTLFLTRACSLRCVYCYASGGEHPNLMPWQVAKAAVDLVVENAATLGKDSVGVSFHGGGEPTIAWSLLTGMADYARECGTSQFTLPLWPGYQWCPDSGPDQLDRRAHRRCERFDRWASRRTR